MPRYRPTTKEELGLFFQDGGIEESSQLDYKSGEVLTSKNPKLRDDISSDVSAFANAGGGTIIYGIRETSAPPPKPDRYAPINVGEFSRERLEELIGSIQPRIDGLEIMPIHVGPEPTDFCYVVVIPPGVTAHQATDGRYYRRRNFQRTWMEDYEIRDVMNRRKHPKVSARMTVVLNNYPGTPILSDTGKLLVRLNNDSPVLAKNVLVEIKFPHVLRGHFLAFTDGVLVGGEEEKCYWRIRLTNGIGQPLFPFASFVLQEEFELKAYFSPDQGDPREEIELTVYADEMPPVTVVSPLAMADGKWA